jgi:hypothetical protein
MKKLPVALAVVAIVLAASACAGGHRASEAQGRPRISVTARIIARTVSSSRLILGGRVRCTATLTTPVSAGQRIANTFSFHNVSSRPVWVAYDAGSFVLRSPDGTTYDTTLPAIIGGPAHGNRIQPGVTRTDHVFAPRVRWSGPLRIIPRCDGKALPAVRVRETSSGPAPSGRAAVADVVKASGFLLRRCRPRSPGVPVHGEIDAPDGSAPALRATCFVATRLEHGFVDAQLMVVAPPGRLVRLTQPYEQLRLPRHTPPVEAVAWEFVVTRHGARPVAAETAYSDDYTHRFAPVWTSTGSRWKRTSSDPCGGEGGFGGRASPTVFFFLSACVS